MMFTHFENNYIFALLKVITFVVNFEYFNYAQNVMTK